MVSLSEFKMFAEQLADAAGAVIRPYFGMTVDVETKADQSPVSIADREAEAAIRALITAHFPDHGIFGEEYGVQNESQRFVWVIDPIDGTRAFLAGKKEWGTLIALCDHGVPVLGILDQPITGERWVGIQDGQTMCNDNAVHTRECASITQAEISATYCAPPDDALFAFLAGKAGKHILAGDCYAYGMLARGERDIVCDTSLKPYDILALVPIIEAAGGVITGWDGQPITLTHYASALAAGTHSLHAEALALLTQQQ